MGAEIFNKYESQLAHDAARIAFRRNIVNSFSIPQGTSNWHSYNLFSTDVPCRIWIGKLTSAPVTIKGAATIQEHPLFARVRFFSKILTDTYI